MEKENQKDCDHLFSHKAGMEIDGIYWDFFYCQKCLNYVKKKRVCPSEIESM